KERLGEGNGVVSALSIVAILAGIFVYSVLFEAGFRTAAPLETEAEVLRAIAPIGFLLILNSLIEVVMMYRLPEQLPTGVTTRFSWSRYLSGRTFKEDMEPLMQSRIIRLSVAGLAVFWAVGQVMLAAFPAFYKETVGDDNTILV